MVGNGDAMGVTGQVVQNILRTAEGRLGRTPETTTTRLSGLRAEPCGAGCRDQNSFGTKPKERLSLDIPFYRPWRLISDAKNNGRVFSFKVNRPNFWVGCLPATLLCPTTLTIAMALSSNQE